MPNLPELSEILFGHTAEKIIFLKANQRSRPGNTLWNSDNSRRNFWIARSYQIRSAVFYSEKFNISRVGIAVNQNFMSGIATELNNKGFVPPLAYPHIRKPRFLKIHIDFWRSSMIRRDVHPSDLFSAVLRACGKIKSSQPKDSSENWIGLLQVFYSADQPPFDYGRYSL